MQMQRHRMAQDPDSHNLCITIDSPLNFHTNVTSERTLKFKVPSSKQPSLPSIFLIITFLWRSCSTHSFAINLKIKWISSLQSAYSTPTNQPPRHSYPGQTQTRYYWNIASLMGWYYWNIASLMGWSVTLTLKSHLDNLCEEFVGANLSEIELTLSTWLLSWLVVTNSNLELSAHLRSFNE